MFGLREQVDGEEPIVSSNLPAAEIVLAVTLRTPAVDSDGTATADGSAGGNGSGCRSRGSSSPADSGPRRRPAHWTAVRYCRSRASKLRPFCNGTRLRFIRYLLGSQLAVTRSGYHRLY